MTIRSLKHGLLAAGAAVTLFIGGFGAAQADIIRTGNLYVSDYGLSVMDRYQYTYDQTTNVITSITPNGIGGNTSNAYFLGSSANPIKEGIHGTANDLIVVGGVHGSGVTSISRFALDGTFIGTIPVDFSSYNGGNVGIGNTLVTPDGKYLYAPLEAAGYLVKIDLSNGHIAAQYAMAGVHDVAIAANGNVYAANYNAASASIISLDANLTAGSVQTLVTASNSGISAAFRPTGLSIAPDGSLYVDNNARGGPDSVLHYNIANNAGTLSASLNAPTSYIGNSSQNALEFTFGNNIGPDGKLYIAALGGGGSGAFSVTSNYIDGIYQFNPVSDTVSLAIMGYKETAGPAGPSGLSAPKYLQFDSNFITQGDIGIPEPASMALLLAGIAGLAGLRRRVRRR